MTTNNQNQLTAAQIEFFRKHIAATVANAVMCERLAETAPAGRYVIAIGEFGFFKYGSIQLAPITRATILSKAQALTFEGKCGNLAGDIGKMQTLKAAFLASARQSKKLGRALLAALNAQTTGSEQTAA